MGGFLGFLFSVLLELSHERMCSNKAYSLEYCNSRPCLVLKFGVTAGKDERNIAIFVQKSKISSTEENAPAIDIDDCANDMVRQVRCEIHHRSGDFLGSGHTTAWNQFVDRTDLSSIPQDV